MRMLCAFCGLFLIITIVNCNPIDKKDAEEDLNPLNEVYVIEADDVTDGERSDRDKRKIGIGLGVSNGIINFVFDKVDSFIDSKTKALSIIDETNKAENVIFGIDNKHSATSEFLNKLMSQKFKAASGSIGPLINSVTTLFSGASAGISKALVSKIAPLSSLSGGLSGGSDGTDGAGHAGGSAGASGSAILGNLLTQKIGSLSSLSQGSGGLGSLSGGSSDGSSGSDSHSGSNGGTSAGAGINLGAFANLAGLG
ncbi:PREDICTED: location of vulva defective 1 isoform X2 [Acromyrmex echinatior]|uniref:location of vulva defective 1 isoform X2 n=1 Tax=Acromyrmex echinatior TaxID=103372 RepID=UPI000580C2DF|nr:PREDICTED: location of vulva defective 1 isoform X2 [Acromyrmex echinatior]